MESNAKSDLESAPDSPGSDRERSQDARSQDARSQDEEVPGERERPPDEPATAGFETDQRSDRERPDGEGPDGERPDGERSDDERSDDERSDDERSDDERSDGAGSDDEPSDAAGSAAARSSDSSADGREEPAPLLLPANPIRLRGLVAFFAGSVATIALMANAKQLRAGVPLGFLGVLVAVFGLLDFFGTFDDPEERVARRTSLSALRDPLLYALGSGLLLFAILTLTVAGRLPVAASAVLVPGSFLGSVIAGSRLVDALRAAPDGGEPPPLYRRHGFWLVVAVTLLHLPLLGSHSLTDPWETHYGEVAREILARDDWVSLWWAHEEWFWSKPILDFWVQALAMASLGVDYRSGGMLASASRGLDPWPEWAVRMPIFLMELGAIVLLYKAVARIHGKRAALFGGLALATMPQWFFIAHQTMTDMPFVAAMSAAMALFLLGVHEDPDRLARTTEVALGPARLRVGAAHVVFGAIALVALPQALYLVAQNVTLQTEPALRVLTHLDRFSSGSAGNCGLPGQPACVQFAPVVGAFQPALQGLLWLGVLVGLLVFNAGERRVQRLYFLGAWLAAALATMAKGPAGFGLPILCALAYVVVTRRWRVLTRMELTSGLLILLAVAMPWFVAMYARHGSRFTDRLIFHDMFKRAFTHVHDTNEGDDVSFRYYVWQLGYATFPWTGLVPAALLAWLRRREDGSRADVAVFLGTWALFAFALFSLMPTKFHHYILPALPPIAMLVGILCAELTEGGLAGLAPFARSAPERADGTAKATFEVVAERALLGAAFVGGAALVFAVGRDLYGAIEPNQARLLHLFTYQYRRVWPPSLDFKPWLEGFAIAAGTVTLALAWVRVRGAATLALAVVAAGFTVFGLDVYFMKTSPHWGQRGLVLRYQHESASRPAPLVAYQMNWKGENFYMGNRIPIFVSSGKKFQDYILDEKRKGTKTFYFITEPSRTTSLSIELGNPRMFDKLTTPEDNNKFVLVRATFE